MARPSPSGRWRPHLLWPFLLLLAAFVIFLEFIAEVGGTQEPATSSPVPVVTPQLAPSPIPSGITYPHPEELELAEVVEVIDGDTIYVRLDDQVERIRYYGSDTPEVGEPCFVQAKEWNDAVVGPRVRLLADQRERDKAGRLLRYVFTEDGHLVDAILIAQGLAKAWRKDGAYRDQLLALEASARQNHIGCLWARPGAANRG